jgi:ATP-dependent DNA helicase RecG
VEQRVELQRKGDRPDVLVMTATPIPRSLALTAYGDLEISSLDELPPGRSPVATEVLPAGRRREVYQAVRADLAAGAQVYVVFPLIEGSEAIAAEAVGELGERIRTYLGEVPSAVLHGRLDAEQRERTMKRFAAGELRVLLATTIIEVGVDVPEAAVMVIESAERFGLAQLHQLRGRVGRGVRPSRCVALHGRLSDDARRRLEIFASTSDGFRLAEADLELRGPGDLLGTRQSGMPTFRLAHPLLDQEWLERARADARELVTRLDEPALGALRERLVPRGEARDRRLAGG